MDRQSQIDGVGRSSYRNGDVDKTQDLEWVGCVYIQAKCLTRIQRRDLQSVLSGGHLLRWEDCRWDRPHLLCVKESRFHESWLASMHTEMLPCMLACFHASRVAFMLTPCIRLLVLRVLRMGGRECQIGRCLISAEKHDVV